MVSWHRGEGVNTNSIEVEVSLLKGLISEYEMCGTKRKIALEKAVHKVNVVQDEKFLMVWTKFI